jgi:hypothetical protein
VFAIFAVIVIMVRFSNVVVVALRDIRRVCEDKELDAKSVQLLCLVMPRPWLAWVERAALRQQAASQAPPAPHPR